MLLYQPRFCHPDRAAKPSNLSEAESMAPGINPLQPLRAAPKLKPPALPGDTYSVCLKSGSGMSMSSPCCDPSAP
jgi:hypothetical protein